MFTPPSALTAKPRVHRKRRGATSATLALTLVSAVYDSTARTLLLTFGRAIDLTGIHPGQISVNDPITTGAILVATTIVNSGSDWVRLHLSANDDASGETVTMTASGGTGIVATDGGSWAGVTELGLPYP